MDQIDVRILDRDYRLAVKPEDKAQLLEAAQAVDEKMRAIRDSGRLGSADRIAVMAALQLANELIGVKAAAAAAPSGEAVRRIRKMTDDIDAELKRQESLF